MPLAEHFVADGKPLSTAASAALQRHAWPGNVRELRNTMQRAALLAPGDEVFAANLGLQPAQGAASGAATSDEPDRAAIEDALERNNGVLAQAAAQLGLSRQALYRRLDRLGIRRD